MRHVASTRKAALCFAAVLGLASCPAGAQQVSLVPAVIEADRPDEERVFVSLEELEAGRGPQTLVSLLGQLPSRRGITLTASDGSSCAPFVSFGCGGLGFVGTLGEVFDAIGLALVHGTVLEAAPGAIGGSTLGTLLAIEAESVAHPSGESLPGRTDLRRLVRDEVAPGSVLFLAYRATPEFVMHGVRVCEQRYGMPDLLEPGDEILVMLDGASLGGPPAVYMATQSVIVIQRVGKPILLDERWRPDLEARAAKHEDLSTLFAELARELRSDRH